MTTNTKTKNTKTKSNVNGKKTFEESLAALEEVIDKLEEGDLTLDEALRNFEDGVGLIKNCENHISRAKGKLAQLMQDQNGNLQTEELNDEELDDL